MAKMTTEKPTVNTSAAPSDAGQSKSGKSHSKAETKSGGVVAYTKGSRFSDAVVQAAVRRVLGVGHASK